MQQPGENGKGHDVVAAVVLPCADLDATLAFFLEALGFRLDAIFPADQPRVAEVSGFGLRLRLEKGVDGTPGVLQLRCPDASHFLDGRSELTAPNGTHVRIVEATRGVVLPVARPSFTLCRMGDRQSWQRGRAGMRYRDLIPGRQAGRTIASHIHIPEGGLVPDYVHFHRIHFQMIYCYRGWVRVVYEDQGEPFVLQAGDCVLQPPQIRHRVLESAPGLEVIEISCPAEHETYADHDLQLPNGVVHEDRQFHGQRFLRHIAAQTETLEERFDGLRSRDLGLATASDGVATAAVLQPGTRPMQDFKVHDADLLFTFVLQGAMTLSTARRREALAAGDSFVIPPGQPFAIKQPAEDLELLEVALPGAFDMKRFDAASGEASER